MLNKMRHKKIPAQHPLCAAIGLRGHHKGVCLGIESVFTHYVLMTLGEK